MRKKEKQNAAREKFWSECGELFEPTDNYYFRKIKNILTNTTIYSNDALALEKLQNKLAELEDLQAKMKARNAYYRKNKTMRGYEGMSDEEIGELPVYIGNDEELNGIHTAFYCEHIACDKAEDSEYIGMIDADCCNVKLDGRAILIS